MQDHRTSSAIIALRQIFRATEISGRAHAKACGLTTSQHVVLQVLAASAGMTQTDLAREVSLGQPTVTSLLDRLEEWDLVTRQRSAYDRRRMLVQITEKGRETIDRAPSLLHERFVQRFEELADWERSFLVAALERTAELLDGSSIDCAPYLEVGVIPSPNKTGEDTPCDQSA
jgi:DNA-binding MarR family transcriptional regulator